MKRRILSAALLCVLAAAMLPAGGKQEQKPAVAPPAKPAAAAAATKTGKYGESPALAQLVAAGKLPSVEKRLPENPAVIPVVEKIGKYGGTLRTIWKGPSDKWAVGNLSPEFLLLWAQDASKLVPNIAESFDVLENGARYVLHIRKGVRWSDGVEFTSEDVMFQWEDILNNTDLNPALKSWWLLNGQPPQITAPDKYTVQIKFQSQYPLFLQIWVTEQKEFFAPKHYLQQFHPKYADKAKLDAALKESGFQNWTQLFNAKGGVYPWICVGCPALGAWYPAELTNTRLTLERNPYYWKVDPEGNQLPYIDRISVDYVSDKQIIKAKAIAGELDCQFRDISGEDYTLYKENEKKGDYKVYEWRAPGSGGTGFMPNQTVKDPALRELFQDVRFRQALSLAINRDEILQTLNQGIGMARQASIVKGAAFYDPEWESAYVEYDVNRANALLDELGLKWDAQHKFRLRKDGQRLSFLLEAAGSGEPTDMNVLVKEYWAAVGIEALPRVYERSLYEKKMSGNDLQMGQWAFGTANFIVDARQIVPIKPGTEWCNDYALYYESAGKSGTKPEGDAARIIEIWEKLKVESDQIKRNELAKQIVDLHKKNIWIIGTVGGRPSIGIVKNNLRNVPKDLINDDLLRAQGNAKMMQFYFDR